MTRAHAALVLLMAAPVFAGCKGASEQTPGATTEAVSSPGKTPAVDPATAAPDNVVVYYFHGHRRCRTCVGIQRAILATIDQRFAAETASGALVFREVDIDEPANAHFVKEYDLASSSMVVAAKSGDKTVKWQNCDQVWPLAHDEAALVAYAEKQIRSYLELLRRT